MAAWLRWILGLITPPVSPARCRSHRPRQAFCRRGPSAGAHCCRTRQRNAHRTVAAEEREVLYPWHPWSGHVVHVHEAVAKEAGGALRCSLEGGDAGRWLELPAWMLDRVSCAPMRIEERPCVDVDALSTLKAVLATAPVVVSPAAASSQAPVSGAGCTSRNPNRGDIHATLPPPPSARSSRSSSVRSLRSAECAASGGNADLAAIAGDGTHDGDAADRPASGRTRRQRSPVRVDRRAR